MYSTSHIYQPNAVQITSLHGAESQQHPLPSTFNCVQRTSTSISAPSAPATRVQTGLGIARLAAPGTGTRPVGGGLPVLTDTPSDGRFVTSNVTVWRKIGRSATQDVSLSKLVSKVASDLVQFWRNSMEAAGCWVPSLLPSSSLCAT